MNTLTTMKIIFFGFLLSLSTSLLAMDLQEAMTNLSTAKMQGLLGEQTDGYLGVVVESTEAKQIATLINNARRSEYERLAKGNNLSMPDVEAIAGKKAIEKTPTGQFVKVESKWVKKP